MLLVTKHSKNENKRIKRKKEKNNTTPNVVTDETKKLNIKESKNKNKYES